MRKGEILGLTWDKVDLKGRVIKLEAKDTKDKEPRKIQIPDELLEIFKVLPRALHDNHVFLFRGKPFGRITAGLRRACKGAGILYGRFVRDGFVFHDLRHTFNTYMRKAGIAKSVIKEITGHSTDAMYYRSDSVDLEDKRKAVDQLEAYLHNVDQTEKAEG